MAETSFPYPPKPWDDGQQVTRENPDGTFTTATYEAARNVWHVETRNPQTLERFIYTDHVLLTNPVGGSNAVARGELSALLNDGEESPGITTQEGANQASTELSKRQLLDARRTQDNVDFLQETVSSGLWVRTTADQPAALPGPTEFFVRDLNNNPVYTFPEARRFEFAGEGTGVLNQNPNLANTKVGDYLIVQNNNDNEFGVYVVDEIQVIGQPSQGGNWYIQMEVRVVSNKAFGNIEDFDHCTVRTTRPVFLLPADTAPVVPAEGYVWFKSDTHELYISTRGDTDPEEPDVPQWVKIGPGDGTVDTNNLVKKSGDTMTGRLNLKYDYEGLGEIGPTNERILRSNGNRPTGSADGNFCDIYHLDAADATTAPVNEFKVRWENAQDFIDNHNGDPFALVIDDGSSAQVWICDGPGWVTAGPTWHVSAAEVLPPTENYSGVLTNGRPVNFYIYGSGGPVDMPYATVLESAVIARAVARRVVDENGDGSGDYLPLTGGKLTGDLDVTGSKIKTLLLDSGQNSQLQIQHNGNTKVYIGSDTVTFQEQVKLNKEGTEDFHAVTKAYVDNAVGDINLDNLPYLSTSGGRVDGGTIFNRSSGVVLEIRKDDEVQTQFWASGAISVSNYTNFQDDELVTKKYVDDKVAAGGGGFSPGDKVAASSSASAVQGGFYIQNGNLYCKIT